MDSEMFLNPYGEIVRECWKRISAYFPYVEIDEFVVMPNHFHAIFLINESVGAKQGTSASPGFDLRGNQGEAGESLASPLRNNKKELCP